MKEILDCGAPFQSGLEEETERTIETMPKVGADADRHPSGADSEQFIR